MPRVAAGHRQIGRDRGRDAGAKGSQRAAGQGPVSPRVSGAGEVIDLEKRGDLSC